MEERICENNVDQHVHNQGVYKLNWTNFQGIPGGISRKIQDMFALLWPAIECSESTSLPKYEQNMICTTWAMAKTKRATSFLNKRSGTQFYHDWKPMQSIIDFLHKNFQKDQIQGDLQDFQEGF